MAVTANPLKILDLVQTVAPHVEKYDAWSIKLHADFKVAWKVLTVNRLKASQYALDSSSIISRIIEIKRYNKVQFEYVHFKTKQRF